MDPISAGIITGGMGVAGAYMQNQQSSAQAERMMGFQQGMSNTAHQREVFDLKQAGLNPILSALGSGASTPGGAQAPISNMGEGISKGMDTAIAVRSQNQDLKLKGAQQANTEADTGNKNATAALIENQSAATAKDIEQKSLQNNLLKQTLPSMIKKAKAEGDYSEINQLMGIINSGANSAGSLLNIGNILKNGIPLKGNK